MNKTQDLSPMLPMNLTSTDTRVFLNSTVWMEDHSGLRVIYCHHEPIFRIPLGDLISLRLAAVTLRLNKAAGQEEISRAFGHSVPTQRRWEREYQRSQLAGLMPKRRSGRPSKVAGTQEALVRAWFAAGVPSKEMARRLAVDKATIRRTLRRLELKRPAAAGTVLFSTEGPAATARREEAAEGEGRAEGGVEEAFQETAELSTESGPKEQGGERTGEVGERREEAHGAGLVSGAAERGTVAAVEERSWAARGEEGVWAAAAAACGTIDHDPRDRSGDRAMACVGLLEDAEPLFGDARAVPRAGVLLAIPLLVRARLVETFRETYGTLGPAFYGLRTLVVTLLLYALLRIKRVEHVKEYRPTELGQIVGLDRGPEVKTIRRKVSELGAAGCAAELQAALAQRRIAADAERVAFLYVDGHVREYHGQYRLAPAKKPQRQVVTPAATDTWVHDAQGAPLLVVTHEINAQLTQVLEPILEDARAWVPAGQRGTVVFDRGGFSAKLFARLQAAGWDVLTYRKGRTRALPRSRFTVQREWLDGAWREYEVCDRARVRVGKVPADKESGARRRYHWMREVRVWRKDGRQTSILTHRRDLSAVAVPYRMFLRWRQENYLKYMGAEFELDALVEYGAEPVSAEVDRPNPERKAVQKRLQRAREEVERLQAELGAKLSASRAAGPRTVRGFKCAQSALRRELAQAEAEVQRCVAERAALPMRVPAVEWEKLKTEKKLIVDAIKMTAYQIETELLGMLGPCYARSAEEGRTLLQAAFQSAADLEVRDGELRVTLAPQSSPHRTAAVAGLCAQLEALPTLFPGSSLRLRLAVAPHETAHLSDGAWEEV